MNGISKLFLLQHILLFVEDENDHLLGTVIFLVDFCFFLLLESRPTKMANLEDFKASILYLHFSAYGF